MDRSYPIPVLNNRQRCPYVSLHLDCNVNGFATVECFKPSHHENCRHRKSADERAKKNAS